MKILLFSLVSVFLYYAAGAQQCPAPFITASGPTTLCSGGSVTLSAPPADKIWTRTADLAGTPRMGAVGFSIGSKGYIGTGAASLVDAGSVKKDFWEYDPATNAWTQKADFGGPARSYATGFGIGNRGYVGTGTNGGGAFKDFWEYNPTTNAWVQKADFGGPARSNAAGFSISGKGYIGTGTNGTPVKDFWEYNPATDAWVQKTDFGGTARSGATGFATGGKGYIGTGYEGGTSYRKDFWAYDPVTNAWAQKADFGGSARAYAAGFSIDSMGYTGTGSYTSSGRGGVITYISLNDFWEYNAATNTWTQRADYGGGGFERAAGFSIGNKGYIGTGRIAVDPYTGYSLQNFWVYGQNYTYLWSPGGQTSASITVGTAGNYTVTTTNTLGCSATSAAAIVTVSTPVTPVITTSGPATVCPGGSVTLSVPAGSNVWTKKANFGGVAKYWATGFSIGSKGYLGTGINNGGGYGKDLWEYNPATNAWTQKADFGGTARYGATGFSAGSKGYIGTGNDGSYKKDFWEYDPITNTWTQKADFGGTARGFATGFSTGNKGYICTGTDGNPTRDLWEYDPSTNGWRQRADFGGTARWAATGFGTGGKGYIGTGLEGGISYKKDFWEYDPAGNIWTQKADFGGPARYGATGFSIGTKGYIGTGSYNSSGRGGVLTYIPLADFWEYNSATGTWVQKADYGGGTRDRTTSFSIGSKGYVGTGRAAVVDASSGVQLQDFWEYDPGYTYSWSPGGQTTPSITVSTSGNYAVTTTNAQGCSATSAVAAVRVLSAGALYVDGSKTSSGDGSSWATAYKELYEALTAAGQCGSVTSILVAKGTYKPTDSNSRDSAFSILRGGLKLYGGYPAGGGGARNIAANPTILSGDIGRQNDTSDNSRHVFVLTGLGADADSVVIDGFTITAGNAYGSGLSNGGGGMYLDQNSAGARIAVRNCSFSFNYSNGFGGGMYNRNSSPSVTNCSFVSNTSNSSGGGIFNNSSSALISRCTFIANRANTGGGMGNQNFGPTVTNCTFISNSSGSGGGMSNSFASPRVTGCIFSANNAAYGGGIVNSDSYPQLVNCVFSANTADYGGGMANSSLTPFLRLPITNCTFSSNKAVSGGGGIYNQYAYTSVAITNCIIWDNSNGGITNVNGSTPSISFSDVQGTGTYPGSANINADPRFVNPADPDGADNIFGTADDGLRLQPASPAINKGSNDSLPAGISTDIAGAARIQQAIVDLGAYESPYTADTCSGDQTPPLITPRNITVYLNASGSATIQPFSVIQSVTDNCTLDSASVRISQSSFSCADLGAPDSTAGHLAYTAATATGNQAWRGELGMEFRVNRRIFINQLGAFDHQGNGISGTQNGGIRVAIFNKATQQIVPGLDAVVSGQGDALISNHRLKNIARIALLPGDYVIVAKGYNAAELNGNTALGAPVTAGDNAGGAISYTGSSLYGFDTDNGFNYPQYADGGPANRYLAGTFSFQVDSTIHQAYTASTSTGNQSWGGELGMEFRVDKRISINRLGAFDHQGNGISGTQNGGIRVAIFNKATQQIVPGLDAVVSGQGDSYSGNHRFVNITPVSLPAGNYVVVTKGYNAGELNGNSALGTPPASTDGDNGAIAFTGSALYGDARIGGFNYPLFADAGPAARYLAGSFTYRALEGNKTVTITASDSRGNTATATAQVTVRDTLGACNSSAAAIAVQRAASAPVDGAAGSMIRLYPNPARDRFTVQLSGIEGTRGTIEIMDINGRVLEQRVVSFGGKANAQTQAFSLSGQPSGVYFVRVQHAAGVKTLKVIVAR